MKKHLIIGLVTLIITISAVGCRNTAQGMGQDVERAGEKIQEKTD